MELKCSCCEKDTEKRVVIKRIPLTKLDTDLPPDYEEYHCNNKIKFKRLWFTNTKGRKVYKWTEEECRNNIIVKKVKKCLN